MWIRNLDRRRAGVCDHDRLRQRAGLSDREGGLGRRRRRRRAQAEDDLLQRSPHRRDVGQGRLHPLRRMERAPSRSSAKFLNLFPSFKEGMVHKIIDGSKKEVKDELQMYITEARFMLSRPAASIDLKSYATLPFIQSIDPSIKHEVIKPSDVSVLKDEKVHQQQEPRPRLVRRHRRHRLHPLELQARRQAADRRRARQQAARQRQEDLRHRSSSRASCGCCRRRMSTRQA